MNPITTRLTVRIGDINYGGHLGHDRLITLLHQAGWTGCTPSARKNTTASAQDSSCAA